MCIVYAHVFSRPSSFEQLQKIEDLPAAKAEHFGKPFLQTISVFCVQHNLSVDQFPSYTLKQVCANFSSVNAHTQLVKCSEFIIIYIFQLFKFIVQC